MKNKAQSTLEYALILVVIIMAILYAARDSGPLRSGLDTYFDGMESAFSSAAENYDK